MHSSKSCNDASVFGLDENGKVLPKLKIAANSLSINNIDIQAIEPLVGSLASSSSSSKSEVRSAMASALASAQPHAASEAAGAAARASESCTAR